MEIFKIIGVTAAAYIIGAVPFGMITVWLMTGKDLRKVASGRTGGTNAMRAAGVPAGLITAIMDILKGFGAVLLAQTILPHLTWVHVIAPLAAILGHNYSIFLAEWTPDHRLKLRGAGGATCLGGMMGLWPPSILIVLPLGFAIWYGIGYASVTTLSVGIFSMILFAIRAEMGLSPWVYTLYGFLAELVMIWSLRPNLVRLRNGTERLQGWRARRQRQQG